MVTLGDETLDLATERLAVYRSKDDLSKILEQYSTLIENYKRLKSDYEEERELRERYKQQARRHERNPFALVVVDGDGYVFDKAFIREGEEGGIRAAKQLNDTIKDSLRRKGLEGCEIMVRVYANLVSLSKHLNKNGLCGAEKRSLSSFTAGFNRSYGLTDFIDAGELKENADHKMKAMLRLYAENAQCKHIYFAACHDVGYVADLTPYRGNTDLFTLIRTSSVRFHSEFDKLGMNTEELHGVFRANNLVSYSPGPIQNSKFTPLAMRNADLPTNALQPISANDNGTRCTFYAAGKCRNGNNCKFSHVDTKRHSLKTNYNSQPTSHINDSWRDRPTDCNYNSYFSKKDTSTLPKHKDIPAGHVAININGDRLDPYIPSPSTSALQRFGFISGPTKLCNKKHLIGSCYDKHCKYNHSPVPADLMPILELMSRSIPCSKRGACRKLNCIAGHVCQKMDCRWCGGKALCRFEKKMCLGDFEMERIVPAVAAGSNWEDTQSSGSGGIPMEESEDGVSILDDTLTTSGSIA